MDSQLTLRLGFPDDELALRRLAALDSAEPLRGPALLAEVDGELRAALSLGDGRVIADPFRHSAAVVVMLRSRAAQLRARPERRRGLGRLGLLRSKGDLIRT